MSSSSSSSSDETSASELSTSNCETLNRYSSTNDLDRSFLKYEKQTSSQVRFKTSHNGENDSQKRQLLALGVCSQSWKLNNLSKKILVKLTGVTSCATI